MIGNVELRMEGVGIFDQVPAPNSVVEALQIREALEDILDYLYDQVAANTPVRSGFALANLHKDDVDRTVTGWKGAVGFLQSADYIRFPEGGTGLFGPRRQLITPLSGNVLKLESIGGNVFAKHTRGQRGQHFVRLAAETTDAYAKLRLAGLRIQLGTLGRVIS